MTGGCRERSADGKLQEMPEALPDDDIYDTSLRSQNAKQLRENGWLCRRRLVCSLGFAAASRGLGRPPRCSLRRPSQTTTYTTHLSAPRMQSNSGIMASHVLKEPAAYGLVLVVGRLGAPLGPREETAPTLRLRDGAAIHVVAALRVPTPLEEGGERIRRGRGRRQVG